MPTLVDRIDALLPQTQCTKCGFDGCRPYAEALADGSAEIDRCPPGGDDGILQLATLLGRPVRPLDTARGQPGPLLTAVIVERHCIGCTLCIQACPVDAIVGANKRMHTVLPALCTGCELCVPPCPVDCIEMRPVVPRRDWGPADATAARARHRQRQVRLRREQADNDERLRAKALDKRHALSPSDPEADRKRAILDAALARARMKRHASPARPATPSPGGDARGPEA